jgi:TIR domain
MSEQPVQVFMSYAWKDNTLPPGDDPWERKGFVKALYDSLEYDLDSADPKPQIWWDSEIDEAEQFDPKIFDAIQRSSYFLIILSKHWQESAYCQKELQFFRERWKDEDEFRFKHRIILAHKTAVPEEKRSKLLPVQRGLTFFSKGPRDAMETSYFQRGRGNTQFYFVATELARVLAKRAKFPPGSRIWSEDSKGADVAIDVRAGLTGTADGSGGGAEAVAPGLGLFSGIAAGARRKIYLAKPTADTQTDYLRLHKELNDHGFEVVPAAAGDIPQGMSGSQFIEDALKGTVASIHLIGKAPSPDTDHGTVSLQLAEAANKVAVPDRASDARTFRRIIWAPRVFEGAERDPIETFRQFTPQLPSDRIESDTISRFIESLLPYLDTLGPDEDHDERAVQPQSTDGEVYLCHDESDEEYAFGIANILVEINKDYVLPVYGNASEQERTRFHRENLAKCATVMMCWANASEYWARAQSMELANWRGLGRKQQFAHRALIAGPPPTTRKEDKRLRLLFPRKEIDILLNSATTERPLPEVIKGIFAVDTNAAQ